MAEKDYDDEWGVMMEPYKKDAAPAADDDPFEFARGEAEKRLDAQEAAPAAEPAAPAKAMSFKEAFASNRKSGAKTFEWNGKKYTTNLKAGASAPAKTAAPAKAAEKPVMSVAKKDVAPQKSAVNLDAPADVTMYTAGADTKLNHFGTDGKPKASAPAAPAATKPNVTLNADGSTRSRYKA